MTDLVSPEIVRTDCGIELHVLKKLSNLFLIFSKKYGFHHITSSPKHPQSNGFIDAVVETIKKTLKSLVIHI